MPDWVEKKKAERRPKGGALFAENGRVFPWGGGERIRNMRSGAGRRTFREINIGKTTKSQSRPNGETLKKIKSWGGHSAGVQNRKKKPLPNQTFKGMQKRGNRERTANDSIRARKRNPVGGRGTGEN